MNTSLPNERSPRVRGRSLAVAVLAIASILGVSLATNLQLAGADPGSGVGPITVDDSGHWFEYSGNGEPYFMAGSGGPEGFLYYSDSRKQQIVDQLIDNDVRAIYIHAVRSNGGDGGGNENPFIGSNPNNGVDPNVLDEWDSYLSQLDDAGIVTWFHLYDDGARPYGACNPDLPDGEKAFVKTIVERFGDYQHLVWLPTEEHIIKACSNNDTDVEKAEALAAEIRLHDDVHPVGVHHNNGQTNQYLGNDDIDVFAQQVCQQSRFTSVDGIHDAGEFGEDVYVMAECHPWHKDLLDSGQRTTLRQSFWSSVMAGGYVLFYDAWESNDPTDDMLADLGRINAFMDTTRFAETVPADQLAAAGTKWVLGDESQDIYIAYSNTNPSTMGVQGMSAGTYDLGWFDPVTGQRVAQTVTVGNGTATFAVPGQIGAEVALSIEPSGGGPDTTVPPTTVPSTTVPPTTVPPTTVPSTTVPPTTVASTTVPSTTVPPTTTEPPESERVELVATEDAYLQGSEPYNNDQLRLEAGNRTRVGYIQFDTETIGDAETVQLNLTIGSDAGRGTLAISRGSETPWTADTLSTANAPLAKELLATTSGSYTRGQKLSFDLPVSVVDATVLNLVITHDGSGIDDISLAATETGDGPTLIVTSSIATPTPTTAAPPTTPTTPSTTAGPPTTAGPTTTEPTPTTDPPTTPEPEPTPEPEDPAMVTVVFDGTDTPVANPERGFHKGVSVTTSTGKSTTSASRMRSFYDDGFRLARMYIRLDNYRDSPLPDEVLNNLDEVFANARAAGIKIIPRFSYNFGSDPDAPIERIEQHIDQVTPVLRNNSDVVAVLQAGFIGAWGEWHSSSNGLSNPTDRARVRDALFEALPADRMAQFRYPAHIVELEPTPLVESEAWSGTTRSRTAHKNDCFLANEHDAGTYIPLSRKGEFYDYLSVMTRFTANGGETCQVSAGSQRTDCTTALTELELFHWDYLNIDFYGNTMDRWRNDGCFEEIDARLGYRFQMKSAAASQAVTPGGRLSLELDVANKGFGKLYNPRPINIVLVNKATGSATRIERIADARASLPLAGDTSTLDLSITVPADLAAGSYSIHLELPDGSSSLSDDPRYSIQMANLGTWRAETGTNDLGLDTTVGGTGTAIPTATVRIARTWSDPM